MVFILSLKATFVITTAFWCNDQHLKSIQEVFGYIITVTPKNFISSNVLNLSTGVLYSLFESKLSLFLAEFSMIRLFFYFYKMTNSQNQQR